MPRTHAALPRLFVTPDLAGGTQLNLGKEQSLYLAAVLRKSVGDEVVLFNGRDGEWRAVAAVPAPSVRPVPHATRARSPRREGRASAVRRAGREGVVPGSGMAPA